MLSFLKPKIYWPHGEDNSEPQAYDDIFNYAFSQMNNGFAGLGAVEL